MLDMAKVGPGARVLDVAAGAVEHTITAAKRVGPSGYVLATDISSAILDHAAAGGKQAAWEEIAQLLIGFDGPGGFEGSCEMVAVGIK